MGLEIGHLAIVDTGPSLPKGASVETFLACALSMLKNVPWWVRDDLLGNSLGSVFQRLGRKALHVREWLKGIVSADSSDLLDDLEDLVDLRGLPEDIVERLRYHLELLQEYVPGAYSGPLTLYRARTQPLFQFSAFDLGWGKIARQGVEIINIPGNHRSVTVEPNIVLLVKALCASLMRVDQCGDNTGTQRSSR